MRYLMVFGRRPRRGRVKTRLAAALGADRALALYRAMLADQLRFAGAFAGAAQVEWWADGGGDPRLDAELPIAGIAVRRQARGDLGRRLARAFSEAARSGATATVVVGAGSPTLPASHVEQAFERLEAGAAAVLAPAADGGYVLLGARGHRPELFGAIPWGGPDVAEATCGAALAAGIDLAVLAPWYDVDDRAGLDRLCAELEAGTASARAPETSRLLLDSAFAGVL